MTDALQFMVNMKKLFEEIHLAAVAAEVEGQNSDRAYRIYSQMGSLENQKKIIAAIQKESSQIYGNNLSEDDVMNIWLRYIQDMFNGFRLRRCPLYFNPKGQPAEL